MNTSRSLRPGWLLLPLCLVGGPGCFGNSQSTNSGSAPSADLTHELKLDVKALRSASPLRTQQLLIATITDAQGAPRRRQKVEWRLEGVGTITEVDESGILLTRPPKGDPHFSVSYTDFLPHQIGRNIGHATDDVAIKAGQTWCVISSEVEGETRVTALAPDIHDPESNHLVLVLRWLAAEWSLPAMAVGPYGTPQMLSTSLFRQGNRQQGLAGYQVRYRILDGPPAVLLPGQQGADAPRSPVADVTVTSDGSGLASIRIAQTPGPHGPGSPGRNRVAVEVLAPAIYAQVGSACAVLAEGETLVQWQPPAISLEGSLPATVHVGQEVTAQLTLSNNSSAAGPPLTVRTSLMDGMQYVRSNPPSIADGNQLVWTLDPLAGQGKRTLEVVYRPTRIGVLVSRASVSSSENRTVKVWDERALQTQVLPAPQPQLRVEVTGPATGLVMRQGSDLQTLPLTDQVIVSNLGTDAAPNVRLRVELPAELAHKSGINPLEWSLGALAPGSRQTVPLELLPQKAGQATCRISVVAGDSGGSTTGGARATPAVQAQAEQIITIRETGLSVKLTGPTTRYVGKPFTWDLAVTNNGTSPLAQVTVSDALPAELDLVSASDGGRLQGHEVIWTLERLNPGQVKSLQLTTQANQVAAQTINRARVSAAALETEKGLQGLLVSSGGLASGTPVSAAAEATVHLQGLPAFKLRVAGKGPVEVGERASYTIEVANTGSLPGSGVQVVGMLGPQMRFLAAGGMQYRVEGQKIIFAPLATLVPGQTLRLQIDVQALQAGDARFRAELTSATMQQPMVKENSIHIVGEK